ncbi:Cysteine synthase A [Spironucleus salmonicida]|uniref:Cysteine synthase A n=1 Tax=Spironucleus salmonicida TaxID=348837 RepID=V6LMG0_9EUKA|nr:Cysteine synthase A [Spironucleus salmonicida]|eukprot:EST45820.1 Cysteine synthase A [Spironucleus salmonicida]
MTTLLDSIGNTPLVRLQRLNTRGRVFVKLELKNPGRSVKDRATKFMLLDMVAKGQITDGTRIVEPTSGNTGIGLAMCCSALNIPFVCIMPASMSMERRLIIKAYGAELILVSTNLGMRGCIEKANAMAAADPNVIIPQQFQNINNRRAHELTTGPEIRRQCQEYDIHPAYFVCGYGTGGTISGVSAVLKKAYPELRTVAVEPATSALLSGNRPGKHGIQGIGPGFKAELVDTSLIDEVTTITTGVAIKYCQLLAQKEGIMGGISSGANVCAAIKYADQFNCDVITVISDTGERYISVDGLFDGKEVEIEQIYGGPLLELSD